MLMIHTLWMPICADYYSHYCVNVDVCCPLVAKLNIATYSKFHLFLFKPLQVQNIDGKYLQCFDILSFICKVDTSCWYLLCYADVVLAPLP